MSPSASFLRCFVIGAFLVGMWWPLGWVIGGYVIVPLIDLLLFHIAQEWLEFFIDLKYV